MTNDHPVHDDDGLQDDGLQDGRLQDGRLQDIVQRVGIFSWSTIGVALLIGLAAFLLIEGRVILGPLLLAVVLVFVLNPLVTRLNRVGLHRLFGAVIGFLLIIVALVLIGFAVVPSIASQAQQFGESFPDLYEKSSADLESLAAGLGFDEVRIWTYDEVVDYVSNPDNRDVIVSVVLERAGTVTAGIFEFILAFLLGPAIAFYLLIDLPNVQGRALALLPEGNRGEAAHVGNQLNTAVGGFLRGQLFVALIVGVMLSFGYWLIGLDFWLLIGMVGGLLNIVPFLGPWVGGALGVIVAFATADPVTALWAVVVAVVVQQIDNNFVSPTVLRATVRLHPAMTLIVLVVGGAVAGIWGVIVAVPLAASIKILLGHWWRTKVLGQTWEEASEALIEEHEPPRRRRSAGEEPEAEPRDATADEATVGDGEETG
jgi:predicted PurR-regulated permease PerM